MHHLLLAGLPPPGVLGLALIAALALSVLLDPTAKQRIREQGLQVVLFYLATPMGVAGSLNCCFLREGVSREETVGCATLLLAMVAPRLWMDDVLGGVSSWR